MSSSAPPIDCSASHCLSSPETPASSKAHVISARSAPWRTASAPARPPASSCSASTTIDLPAPVSPVSTVSPGRNSSSTESMRAKSRICRWLSMAEPQPSALDAAAAPVQLRAQDLVVIVRRRMQQRHVLARRAGLQALAGHERAEYRDRKSTRLNSSHEWISYAVFCLKKKKKNTHYKS